MPNVIRHDEGVCLIDTEEKCEKALRRFAVGDVWGIGRRMQKVLEYHGVRTAWDFVCRSEGWVRHEFSVAGVRTWRELQGESCIALDDLPYKKSICMSRSFPGHGLSEWHVLEEAVAYFASECARKLREQGTCCGQVTVFAYTSRFRTDVPGNMIQQQVRMPVPTQDTAESCMRLWKRCGCMRMTGASTIRNPELSFGICHRVKRFNGFV